MVEGKILWCLDLGNTRLKFGRFVDGHLDEVIVRLRSDAEAALDWLRDQPGDTYALLSTGRGEQVWIDRLGERAEVWVYERGTPTPLNNRYETPTTLGDDRLAAAVGAQTIYPKTDCLVIDAGTCLTYEYVSAAGEYRGGSISPGLRMRLQAMNAFTGKLPLVDVALPENPIGTTTETALQNGGIRGAIIELQGVITAFQDNSTLSRVLICGGDAAFLRQHLPATVTHSPHLVLVGLATMYDFAHSK